MALDLNELQQLIESAKNTDAFKVDLKRALRKVNSAAANLQSAIGEVESLMADDYTPVGDGRQARSPRAAAAPKEVDPDAPFGRKKDGTPMKQRGRAAKVA